MKFNSARFVIRTVVLCLCIAVCSSCTALSVHAASEMPQINAKSALLMEVSTGRILGEQNADEALPPASVTKIMTLLLVMEAIDSGRISLSDQVQISANAASMGGSQVYLKEGEMMSIDDLLKSVVVASANDAAVALAEYVAGSEESFVAQMNSKAAELSMTNTHFENTNGLDDTVTHHLTSAKDIALMSRALLAYPKILEYSSIWMDSIRDGTFGLTNTNRLIRFYRGATGLKTGSTARAGFCISATAERDGMHLIAVIMGAPSRDTRNEAAKSMLDWGFANYSVYQHTPQTLDSIRVLGGERSQCSVHYTEFSAVVQKGSENRVQIEISTPETIAAPIQAGDQIGEVKYLCDGELIGTSAIVCDESVPKIGFWTLFWRMLQYSVLV